MAPHRLVSEARHAISAVFATLAPGTRILLAVSGGADSLALAATAAWVAPTYDIELFSLTVNHQIRPDSGAEAQQVVEQMRAFGIEAHSTQISLDGAGNGPEGDARRLRYTALAEFARRIEAHLVLLGHSQTDQAETVLLGLGRGSGPRSLAGMPRTGSLPLNDDVAMARPFLDFTREDLRTICRELNLQWVDDPTNEADGPWRSADGSPLRRAAIRHTVIPALTEALGQDVVGNLARSATMFRQDDETLNAIAMQCFPQVLRRRRPLDIDAKLLAKQPIAIRRRIIRSAAVEAGARGGELVYWHIAAIDKLTLGTDNAKRIDLPGLTVRRENNIIEMRPNQGLKPITEE